MYYDVVVVVTQNAEWMDRIQENFVFFAYMYLTSLSRLERGVDSTSTIRQGTRSLEHKRLALHGLGLASCVMCV